MKVLNTVYLVIYMYVASNLDAQSLFQLQNPSYSPEPINSFALYSSTGWAVGNYGMILRTSNSGITFQSQTSQTTSNIRGQSIVNTQVGYIFDDSSRVFRTINGGLNWLLKSTIPSKINCLHFLNINNGFAALANGIGVTSNGGESWTVINPDISASYVYYGIYFKDGNTGYISAKNLSSDYAYMFKTTNAGINWNWFNTGIDAFDISNIHFSDSMTGWCTGERFGNLYTLKTSNGGVNWSETNTPLISTIPNNIYFSDSVSGYITTNNKILKSNNGGLDWTVFRELNGVNSSYFRGSSEYYLVDSYSRVLRTSNGGSTFDTLLGKQNYTLNKIQNITEEVLWCNGINNSNWKSTNGGSDWIFDNYAASLNIRFSEFTDAGTGYAISERGNILRTSNFGNNWNTVYNYNGEIFSLNFINNYTGWALSGESILMTTNGGDNWAGVSNGNSIIRAEFMNGQTGYGFTGNQLYKTNDSGQYWSLTFTGTIIDFNFINSLTGWILSDGDSVSLILKTSDGGVNWIQKSYINGNINKIKFLGVNTGYLLSYDKLYRSTDSGTSWKYVSFPTSLRVFDFDFINETEGWLCGDNSLIMKLDNGGSIFVNNETEAAEDINLFQNYPNPFNSETNIIFTLRKKEFASLKVYDMLGREVAILLNGELLSGKHQVRYNATGLASGIYYYVLKTSGKTLSRKFAVLK